MRARLPELPAARDARFESQYGLSRYDAGALTLDVEKGIGDFFEAVAARYHDSRKLANWFRGELFRALKDSVEPPALSCRITPEAFASLLTMVDAQQISGNAAKEVFVQLLDHGGDAAKIVDERGLRQVSDAGVIEGAVDGVIAAHPDEVARYRAGKNSS